MTTCLITRPTPEGELLCEQLTQRGVQAIHQPLIEIQAGKQYSELVERIQQAQIIIAISQHAVYWANHALAQAAQSWPLTARYLAIGQKTAHKLSKASQQKVHYPDVSDSEHLLAMDELANVGEQAILILRGNGGRELLHQTLSMRNAEVQYCEAYQRVAVNFDGNQAAKRWQQLGVDTLVITSGEQLIQFERNLPPEHLAWLHQLRLVVPSQRIVDLAQQMGFKHRINAHGAANPDLLRALSNSQ